MFVVEERVVESARAERRRVVRALVEQGARIQAQLMQAVRAADDAGDWRAEGCSSSAAWLAQISDSDYRTAARITRTGEALRALPALDEALATGVLSLDQVAAAVEFATPASDAELARLSVGQAPGTISRVARTIEPPVVADDTALYARRALSMTWTRGGRELAISGRLPLEQGAAFKQAIWQIATTQRTADKQAGVTLEWQQSAADALVALSEHTGGDAGGVRRSAVTMIVHVSEDGTPPFIEGSGPVSTETAERLCCDARRLTIKRKERDLVHSRVGRCASYAQLRALHKRSRHCQYPGCTAAPSLDAHHMLADEFGGETVLANLILLCHRHHKHLHDHHIVASGPAEHPIFRDAASGRAIDNRPHAPPG
jgi:hypothetical protein